MAARPHQQQRWWDIRPDSPFITACWLQGVRSSSRLVSVQHVNNFTTATATHRQQSLALSQVRESVYCCGLLLEHSVRHTCFKAEVTCLQEGYAIKGLLSVMALTEAQEDPDRGSKLQACCVAFPQLQVHCWHGIVPRRQLCRKLWDNRRCAFCACKLHS